MMNFCLLLPPYMTHCPIQALRMNKCEDKPWITKGLENASKKKIYCTSSSYNLEQRRRKINIRNIKIN